jgi:hypothetical protein
MKNVKIKIPKNLPQFDARPALFVSCGEYEAHFYVAHRGNFEEIDLINMPPREEAREKQGFITASRGKNLGAVSHRGAYIEDLKRKFQQKVHGVIHDLLSEHEFPSIFLYAPPYVASRVSRGLETSEKSKIKMKFFIECTKSHPLELIKMYWKNIDLLIQSSLIEPSAGEVKKIISRPKIRRPI